MEFKQDDSCSVQKSSCFLEIPFFKLSLTKGTLYKFPKTGEISIDICGGDLHGKTRVWNYDGCSSAGQAI